MGKKRQKAKRNADSMDVEGADEKGWETGGAAMDTAEGAFGVIEGGAGETKAAAVPKPASTTDGVSAKNIGRFGVVVGGVKKKKVQMSFRQKRRKDKKIEKGVARSERIATTQKKKGAGRDRKKELKSLW